VLQSFKDTRACCCHTVSKGCVHLYYSNPSHPGQIRCASSAQCTPALHSRACCCQLPCQQTGQGQPAAGCPGARFTDASSSTAGGTSAGGWVGGCMLFSFASTPLRCNQLECRWHVYMCVRRGCMQHALLANSNSPRQ